MAFTKEHLEEMVHSVPFWWHSIDLGQGVITKGLKTAEQLGHELRALQLPDLRGKSVLDIGAWDGFYSFEAERRGAKRVLALDQHVWACAEWGDLAEYDEKYLPECKQKGVQPIPITQTPYGKPDELPGRVGFDTARRALGSRVEFLVADFRAMDLGALGTFDVVLFLGLLYHMENPLVSLKRLAAVTREVAVIETHAVAIPGYEDLALCEFYDTDELNGDWSNWWGPNLKGLLSMCRVAGFRRVETVQGPDARFSLKGATGQRRPRNPPRFKIHDFHALVHGIRSLLSPLRLPLKSKVHYYRAIVHAWK
jgi:tRNA (mo5U34)-methyltransferase